MNTDREAQGWLRISLGMLTIAIVLWALYQIRDIIVLLLFSTLVAYALSPVVDALERVRLPFTRIRIGRPAASGLVVIGVLAAAVGVLSRVVPVAAAQADRVLQDLPSYMNRLKEVAVEWEGGAGKDTFLSSWLSSLQSELGRISIQSGRYIGKGLFAAVNVIVRLLGLILIPVATIYVLSDAKKLKEGFMAFVPNARRERAREVLRDVDGALSSYVRGLTVVCIFMGITSGIAFALVGLNYPLVLGLLAGLCEIVPFVGFTIASILIVLVGFFESPWMAVKGFVIYLVLNQILSYVVTPRVMAARLKLHPLTAIVSVLVGAKLGGFVGVVFALPAVAVGKVLLMHIVLGKRSSENEGVTASEFRMMDSRE